MQFSIRSLLGWTTYFALGFATSIWLSLSAFVLLNLIVVHFVLFWLLLVGAFQYDGYRRYFCGAAFATNVLIAFWVILFQSRSDGWFFGGTIGLPLCYCSGVVAAASYRAIRQEHDGNDSVWTINFMTCLIERFLPSPNTQELDLGNEGQPRNKLNEESL